RGRAREAVIDALPELAVRRGREAQWSLRVIVEDPEQGTYNKRRCRQVAADGVQDQQRVVAVSASRDVVRGHHTRRAIIHEPVQVELSKNVVGRNEEARVIALREGAAPEVGTVATRKLAVLVSDQEVDPDRETAPRRGDRHYEPGGSRI